MAVSVRTAFKNVFSDKNFLSKYSILMLLSFCLGLMVFALLAKNYDKLLITIPIYLLALIYDYGYHLKYVKSLLEDSNSKLPEWENLSDMFLTGIKFIGALLLFATPIFLVFLIAVISILIMSTASKVFLILLAIPLFIAMLIEIFLILASPGFLLTYIEQNESIFAFFNLKKVCSYFSVNYFTALFALFSLSLIVSLMASCTTVTLKYSLLYIIPLMISPIVKLAIDNLVSQAYHANKNHEQGSGLALFGYIGEFILLTILYFSIGIILSIKFH